MNNSKFDRYGKVYVRQEKTLESESASPYKVVEGVKFSNLQLDLVSDKENDKSFYGKTYSIGILGHRLKFPTPLGMAEYIDEDLFERAFQLQVEAFEEYGLFSKDNKEKYEADCKALRATDFHHWTTLLTGGQYSKDLDLFTSFMGYAPVDDMLEAVADTTSKQQENGEQVARQQKGKIPYKYISKLVFGIAKIFRSESKENWETVFQKFESLKITGMKQETVLIRYCAALYRETAKAATRHGCNSKVFLDEAANFLEHIALESSSEWKVDTMGNDDKALPMIPVLAHLGCHLVAGAWAVEVFLLHNGIQVDEELSQCALYKTIKTFTALQIRAVNDFFSFDKEMLSEGNEWRSNVGCMMHKLQGFTVEEVRSKMVANANEKMVQVQLLCDMLLDAWKGDKQEQVKQFVQQVYHFIAVNMQGHVIIQRYYKNLTMDCYID